jgi:hypothetical protein
VGKLSAEGGSSEMRVLKKKLGMREECRVSHRACRPFDLQKFANQRRNVARILLEKQ